jgi:hypothetical protein
MIRVLQELARVRKQKEDEAAERLQVRFALCSSRTFLCLLATL